MRLDRQELVGHKDVSTTMICAHILNRGGKGPIALLIAYRAAEIRPPKPPAIVGRRSLDRLG